LLLAGGIVMYLPMGGMAGRYSMPAVWGLDILVALLLTALVAAPDGVWRKAAWAGVGAGLAVVMVAGVGKQEKFAARARMLWDAVHYVEATAAPDTRIAWMSGDSLRGGLNVEEGIHFQWHLYHRGRRDVTIGLFDDAGQPLARVELPPLAGPPQFALIGTTAEQPGRWEPERSFAAVYWLGRRRYDCHMSRKSPAPVAVLGVRADVEDSFRKMWSDELRPRGLAAIPNFGSGLPAYTPDSNPGVDWTGGPIEIPQPGR
jgi:hypothetical protein